MRINKIDNSVNFGYNKALNAQLVKTLNAQKVNKPYFQTILEWNKLANKTEDRLRKALKTNDERLISGLLGCFSLAKSYLGFSLEVNLPELNFCQLEAESYLKESEESGMQDSNNWLKETANSLKEAYKSIQEMKNSETASETDGNQSIKIMQLTPEELAEMTGDVEMGEGEFGVEDILTEYQPTESAKLGFASLGGMKELKQTLNDRVVEMLKNPAQAKLDEEEYGKKMPRGILLYGPPGCGKTTIVEHLSTEAGVPLYKVEAGKIGGTYIHETSQNVERAFDYVESKATPEKPALLLIDDADALFGRRDESAGSNYHTEELSSFLNRIQRARDNNVVVIANTNRYDILDEAMRSRFEEQIYVGLPDLEAREAILKLFLNQRTKGRTLAADEEAIKMLAENLDKFPIRAIQNMSDQAALKAREDGRREITADDYLNIISKSQNLKVKEENYKTNTERKPIGF